MIQLRVRTEYSFGKTYAPLGRVIERLKAIGCTAAGMVDDNTWGHVAWFQACTKAGIQPLLGVECIVTEQAGLAATKMWFLAKSTKGLSELYRALSKAHAQPLAGKTGSQPRLYRKDVKAFSTQIIKFAGAVTDGQWLKTLHNCYIDLSPTSKVANGRKKKVAKDYGIKTVYTSDNNYAFPEDRSVFEFMARADMRPTVQYIMDGIELAPASIRALKGHERSIAAECARLALPCAPMVRVHGDLEALCRTGVNIRKLKWSTVYEQRLTYELGLIRSKDFDSYFLIVADMVRYAKQQMLVGPSRGSAAGSLVCYLAQITEIDPIQHQLFFERFIDVTRKDLPDIDLDFPDERRQMVFDYMAEKYGPRNVAHIGNIIKLAPRSALNKVGDALNIPDRAMGAVKVAMIERSLADERASKCLEDTFTTTEPGKAFIALYPHAAVAGVIEGHAVHTGVHAAGLLVCNEAITNYAVVDAHGIAHIEKHAAEHLGLLKIDVLGLRTLTILQDAGIDLDWYHLPMDDPKAFEIFNKGQLCGIFQFEGNAMRSIADLLTFQSLTEVDAVTALARPGPFAGGVTKSYIARMNGEAYKPIHPLVEAQMRETYGLPIYQEQTMAIVRDIGGFDWTDTAHIRKAMSKRLGEEFFGGFKTKFITGATARGMTEEEAQATWTMIHTMGSWQMNKAHTRSYAVISMWCAYLKAHYPLEFAASTLRHAKDEQHAMMLLREMTKEGLEYRAFDLDSSLENWSIKDGKLLGGFINLYGVGPNKAAKYLAHRQKGTLTEEMKATLSKAHNPFTDLFPLTTKYKSWYTDPRQHGVDDSLVFIDAITEGLPKGAERVFLGELIHKNPRHANEENEIKKRGGVVETGPDLDYLDVRLQDDSGIIGGRISKRDYKRIGVQLSESVPIGAHLMIRCRFWNGIRYAFITEWRRLDTEAA